MNEIDNGGKKQIYAFSWGEVRTAFRLNHSNTHGYNVYIRKVIYHPNWFGETARDSCQNSLWNHNWNFVKVSYPVSLIFIIK